MEILLKKQKKRFLICVWKSLMQVLYGPEVCEENLLT